MTGRAAALGSSQPTWKLGRPGTFGTEMHAGRGEPARSHDLVRPGALAWWRTGAADWVSSVPHYCPWHEHRATAVGGVRAFVTLVCPVGRAGGQRPRERVRCARATASVPPSLASVGVVQELCGVSVVDVSVAVPAGNGVEAGMVILQEDQPPYRRIRMYVAQPEARAIRVAWRSEIPPRPSTWDLFATTVSLLGGSVEGAVLTDVEDGRHYFAELLLRVSGGDQALHVTARPSDAIAVALRCPGARLQARSHVLDGLSRAALPIDDEEPDAGSSGGKGSGGGDGPQPEGPGPAPEPVLSTPGGPKRAGSGGRVVGGPSRSGDSPLTEPRPARPGPGPPVGTEAEGASGTSG